MNVFSLDKEKLIIKNEENVSLNDILCTEDIACGVVESISESSIEIKLFSDIFDFKIGENEKYFFSKRNNYFFLEYFNSILTPSGTLNEIDWIEEYEFISILDEGCKVNGGDTIGFIKYNEIRYPVLVPYNIIDGVLLKNNPRKVDYSKPVNIVEYQGLNYPIFIYEKNDFIIEKKQIKSENQLITLNREFNGELTKLLENYDIIFHISSKSSFNYVKNSIQYLKEFFAKAGNNIIQVIGFNDYPYFSEDYTKIVIERAVTIAQELLLRDYSVLVFFEGVNDEFINSFKSLEGDYKTKSGKFSSLQIVKLQN
jgi:hypothetical protein